MKKKKLCSVINDFISDIKKEHFDKIYQIRCDMVHNGKLGMPQREIGNLKTIARILFDYQLKGSEYDFMSIKEFEDLE